MTDEQRSGVTLINAECTDETPRPINDGRTLVAGKCRFEIINNCPESNRAGVQCSSPGNLLAVLYIPCTVHYFKLVQNLAF